MSDIDRSGSAVRTNVPAMIAAAIGGGGGCAVGMLISHFADFQSFWLKLAAVCSGIVIGLLLSKLVIRSG